MSKVVKLSSVMEREEKLKEIYEGRNKRSADRTDR